MKKVPVNLMLGTSICLINVFPLVSACHGTGDCSSSLKRWKELSPLMGTQGLLAENRVIIVLGGLYNLSCFSSSLYQPPNSYHKMHSLQWDSTAAIPQQGRTITLYPHCAGARHRQKRVEMLSQKPCKQGELELEFPRLDSLVFPAFIL